MAQASTTASACTKRGHALRLRIDNSLAECIQNEYVRYLLGAQGPHVLIYSGN